MPARNQQQQIGEGAIIAEPWAQRVPFQMVHRYEGLARRLRDRLAGHHANQHAANQAGAGCGRDPVEL